MESHNTSHYKQSFEPGDHIDRIKAGVDLTNRLVFGKVEAQENIFIVRNIIEQVNEWQATLIF